MRISFDQLVDYITRPTHSLKSKARLQVPPSPDPFVPPELAVTQSYGDGVGAEVIFIEASAAVGKSTLARALSNRTGAPLLDLAKVPVSTQSLVGLLQSDFSGPDSPVAAFHKGELPLIVDALDEGRLLSGEEGFERFLETTGELLLDSRQQIARPKLLFFGRPDSIGLARVGLQLSNDEFTQASVEVDFFGEDAARQLIDKYARAAASADSAYLQHPDPVRRLVDAYFESIESALGLAKGKMWSSDQGRAFAGYAPVLAALGSLLVKLDNFVEVRNELQAKGTQQAWSVIELVFSTILERERGKLTEQLRKHISIPVPAEAYDAREQLTLLARLIHGESPSGVGRVKLAAADLSIYHKMVEQYLPEHPFVRQNEPANAVLGSLILAHAVYNDLLQSADLGLLGRMSRQPFLWRSLSERLEAQPVLLDGRYVGFVLNSLWNDPIHEEGEVAVRSTPEESMARTLIPLPGHRVLAVEVTLPLAFYSQVRRCSIDIDGSVELRGEAAANAGSVFVVRGPTHIICDRLNVESDVITFEGRTWLEAGNVASPTRLNLHLKKGAEVGWSGMLSRTHPWNRHPSTVEPPYSVPPGDVVEALVTECWQRLPPGAAITLKPDYSTAGDDRLRWTERQYAGAFPTLIKLMLKHNLASEEAMQAKGDPKVRIRFSASWAELRKAVRGQEVAPQYAAFIKAARQAVN